MKESATHHYLETKGRGKKNALGVHPVLIKTGIEGAVGKEGR